MPASATDEQPVEERLHARRAISSTPILEQDLDYGKPRCRVWDACHPQCRVGTRCTERLPGRIEFAAWHLLCLIDPAKDHAYRRKRLPIERRHPL